MRRGSQRDPGQGLGLLEPPPSWLDQQWAPHRLRDHRHKGSQRGPRTGWETSRIPEKRLGFWKHSPVPTPHRPRSTVIYGSCEPQDIRNLEILDMTRESQTRLAGPKGP